MAMKFDIIFTFFEMLTGIYFLLMELIKPNGVLLHTFFTTFLWKFKIFSLSSNKTKVESQSFTLCHGLWNKSGSQSEFVWECQQFCIVMYNNTEVASDAYEMPCFSVYYSRAMLHANITCYKLTKIVLHRIKWCTECSKRLHRSPILITRLSFDMTAYCRLTLEHNSMVQWISDCKSNVAWTSQSTLTTTMRVTKLAQWLYTK